MSNKLKLHTGVELTLDKDEAKRFKALDQKYGEYKVSKLLGKIADEVFEEILQTEIVNKKFADLIDRLEKRLA